MRNNSHKVDNMKTTTLLIFAVLLTTCIHAQKPATIKESKKIFTTYGFSDPDPIADVGKFYPYYRFDGYTNTPSQKAWKIVELENDFIKVMVLPEIGGKIWAAWEKATGKPFIYYNQALQLAQQINDTVWVGIVSGNMGQIFYAEGRYDTAYKLLTMDYNASKAKGFYDNAANSLQWAARTDLALGRKTTALEKIREAFQLLKMWPDGNYLRNSYYTATQIFREMGNYDSAFYYNNLWSAINDSLEKVVATSSLAISKAKLNDETSRYNIQNLNKEKRSQLILRNIIIAAIIVLAFIVVLTVNRQRLKEKLKTEKAEQEKIRMQQEVASAKEQLKMFTENIVEKTNLIEKLESQVKGKEISSEQHLLISELSHQTILTEEDWNQFKSLFEKIYPAFFISLKEKFPDITLAEQRMAALTRLQLTPKQMASMLGISVDSVHKTRQRLRQRLRINPEKSLEETMISI